MEELKTIPIPLNSLPKMIKVKDLIFFDGPLLTHFESVHKENFLFYWVDTDENFNRWLVFRTSEALIDDYLNKAKSLLDLITNPDNGNIYKVDIDQELNFNNLAIVLLNDLPDSYLPDKNSFYTFKIYNSDEGLKEISKKENVGILQAYFNESSKVGKGTIDLEVLAPSLNDLNKINKGIRKAFINKEKATYNSNRPKVLRKNNDKFDELAITQASSFKYFGNTSRSFGALLKSSSQQSSLPNLMSLEDRYIEYFINFFKNSTNIETFLEFIKDIDKNVIDSYKKLLLIINKTKIQFNLNYQNSISNFSISKKINPSQAGEILRNIDNLVYDDSTDIYVTGRFTALHLKTGHYQFESVNENQVIEVSNGYLDADRKEVAWKIKWNKLYDVIIVRRQEKKMGQKKPRTVDTIVSFIELDKTLPLSDE